MVDKPTGITSFDVIRRLRPLLRTKKVGHTGTLDPMASGVLCVGFGWAPKLFRFMEDDHKVYRAVARLGVATDTDDADGEPLYQRPVEVTATEIEAALSSFVGEVQQVPPAHSAIKLNGERAYAKARRGEKVEIEPRPVRIDAISVEEISIPKVIFELVCGKGTYVRSLCRDLGEALGCGAHLQALTRMESGGFGYEDAVTLEELVEIFKKGEAPQVVSVGEMLRHLPRFDADESAALALSQGQWPPIVISGALEEGTIVRAMSPDDELLAVARVVVTEGGRELLRPLKVRPS